MFGLLGDIVDIAMTPVKIAITTADTAIKTAESISHPIAKEIVDATKTICDDIKSITK